MLLKVTMVLLFSLPFASFSSNYGFNNTVLKYPTWSVDNCTGMIKETDKICKTQKTTGAKAACKICNGGTNNCSIHVAILFPEDSKYILNLNKTETILRQAAVDVAALIPEIDFQIRALDDGCKSETGLSQVLDVSDWCPHVIFGHTCDYTLAGVGRIAKCIGDTGAPLLSPSGFTFDFTSVQKVVMDDEFYHLVNIGEAGYASFGEFLHLLADMYEWKKFALMFMQNDYAEIGGESACYLLMKTLINEFSDTPGFDYQSGDLKLLNISNELFLREKIGANYAIILTCANHSTIRNIAIDAANIGMMDRGEYLFLNFALFNNATYPDRPWFDPNDTKNNALAKKGFDSFLTFLPYREADFEKVYGQDYRGSFYLDDVYNSMLMYAQTLRNMTATQSIDSLKGCDVVQYMRGKTYQGANGEEIVVNCNVQRVTDYAVLSQDSEGFSKIIGAYSTKDRTITVWEPGNYSFPSDVPECGFDLSKCPTYDKVNVLFISLISVICFGLIIVATVIYRHYRLKQEIYAQSWKVNYDEIAFLSKERRSSIRSLMPVNEYDEMSLAGDNQLFAQIGYYKSIRVAIKKLPDVKLNLNHKQLYELKVMKDLSNDNLVKFYGACIESPNNCLLIEYCPRGSLQDILENPQYNLDWTFRMSLIMDVARGMHYLHTSQIKAHGALKSSNCLVDSRFVLKVSDFGLSFMRGYDKNNDGSDENSYEYWKRLLWTAPEILRMANPPPEGTSKGDVYSFAIIMEEIIMREGVFFIKGSIMEPKGTWLNSNSDVEVLIQLAAVF